MEIDWAGTRILQKNTALKDKRRVFKNADTHVLTDLREWITPGDREQIRHTLSGIKLPITRSEKTFDKRALILWKWVVDNIEYVSDPEEQELLDYWQFPAETLAVKKGDCEDCAFLLASLLLGSGISSYCVRVAIGTIERHNRGLEQHAWVVYKNEDGIWCLLEATLPNGDCPGSLPDAENYTKDESDPRYSPILCLNTEHVWQVEHKKDPDETVESLTKFVKRKKKLQLSNYNIKS